MQFNFKTTFELVFYWEYGNNIENLYIHNTISITYSTNATRYKFQAGRKWRSIISYNHSTWIWNERCLWVGVLVCEWCLFETLYTGTWLHAFYRSFCLINQIIFFSLFSCFVHSNAFFVRWKVHRNWFHQMNFLTHIKSQSKAFRGNAKWQEYIKCFEALSGDIQGKHIHGFGLTWYFNENEDINYIYALHLQNKVLSPTKLTWFTIVNSSSNSKAIFSLYAHTHTHNEWKRKHTNANLNLAKINVWRIKIRTPLNWLNPEI